MQVKQTTRSTDEPTMVAATTEFSSNYSDTDSDNEPSEEVKQYVESPISPCDLIQNSTSTNCSTSCGPSQGGSGMVVSQLQFGSIALSNSSNVTFGDKTFYKGPVTINQFLVRKNHDLNESPIGCEGEVANATANTSNPSDISVVLDKSEKPLVESAGFHRRRKVIIAGTITLLVILTAVVIIIGAIFSSRKLPTVTSDEPPLFNNSSEPPERTTNIPKEEEFYVVPRLEWLAKPSQRPLRSFVGPVENVIVAHTAGGRCFEQKNCIYLIQNIQNYHIQFRDYADIGYNFLVGGDGIVYEGVGWDKQGTHSGSYNNKSICIAFIGTFTENSPTKEQINSAKLLITEGVTQNKLSSDYKLRGQRQVIATESPGILLFKEIQKWPHWSSQLK